MEMIQISQHQWVNLDYVVVYRREHEIVDSADHPDQRVHRPAIVGFVQGKLVHVDSDYIPALERALGIRG